MNQLEASKEIVLDIVKRLGRATARNVAFELFRRGFQCSEKAVSMRLHRYHRQGLLGRARWGRHGFVYRIVHKGEERLRHLNQCQRARAQNLATSGQTALGGPQRLFDKQFRELLLDFALAKYVTSSVHQPFLPTLPADNQNLEFTTTFKPESEMDFFYLWRREIDKGVQFEMFCKEIIAENKELTRFTADLLSLLKRTRSKDFELGRTIGKLEAKSDEAHFHNRLIASLLRVPCNTQHPVRINSSFNKKKRAPIPSLQEREAHVSAHVLRNTEARPKSLPFAFPAPSAKTLKIMREAAKDVCTSVPFSNKAVVEESSRNKKKGTDVNSWWRYLKRA